MQLERQIDQIINIRGEAAVAVLGRFAVNVINRTRPGKHFVILGWKLGADGRKIYALTALFAQNGTLYAKDSHLIGFETAEIIGL